VTHYELKRETVKTTRVTANDWAFKAEERTWLRGHLQMFQLE